VSSRSVVYVGRRSFGLVVEEVDEGDRDDVFRLVTCVNVHGDGGLAVRLDEALNPRRPRFGTVFRYFTEPTEWPILLAALEACSAEPRGLPEELVELRDCLRLQPSSANQGVTRHRSSSLADANESPARLGREQKSRGTPRRYPVSANARIATGVGSIRLSDDEALQLANWIGDAGLGEIRAQFKNAVQLDRPAVFSKEQRRQLVGILEQRLPNALVKGPTLATLLSALRADLRAGR